MTGPWSFDEAVKAYQDAEVEQRRVEGEVSTAYRNHARAVEAHKLALARRMWELKRDGIPATVCKTLAAGDPHVAALERHAHEAEGLKETALIATWRANSDRKDINGLLSWSRS